MLKRFFPVKDTFITNYRLNGIARTGSNFGGSEILHVYKQTGYNVSSSLAHILTQFDLSRLSSMISSNDIPSSGVMYYLRFANAGHDQTIPTSFDLQVQALTQNWDEGKGRDVEFFADKGFANWDKATSSSAWTVAGASGSGPVSVFHFDDGSEDMVVDVTSIVEQWLSGNISNNGFLVRLPDAFEQDPEDYYIKMFHGRNTFFNDRRPFLEARWNDLTMDHRNAFAFGESNNLFLYNMVRGQFQNISGIGTGSLGVRIVDSSGTIATLTGSHTGKNGTYSVSFVLPTGSYSGSLFRDVWFDLSNPSNWFMTGNFTPLPAPAITNPGPSDYFVSVSNLKNTYDRNEKVRLNLFVRPSNYRSARVLTASLGPTGEIMTKAYYQIVNDHTGEVVVPYDTGSLGYTRMSFGQNGNYFNFYMDSLSEGNVYRLKFMFDVNGESVEIDDDFKFRVK